MCSDIRPPLKQALGSSLTVYSLSAYREDVEALLTGQPLAPVIPVVEDVYPALKAKFMLMDGREFERFVTDILSTVGFQAETTRYSQDGGQDVVGSMNIGGIMDVPVKVQVKRQSGNVGPDIVNALRGTLASDEFGIVVTTAEFTAAAQRTATAERLKTISLVDGDELCRLILDNFDNLSDEVRDQLALKRVFRVG